MNACPSLKKWQNSVHVVVEWPLSYLGSRNGVVLSKAIFEFLEIQIWGRYIQYLTTSIQQLVGLNWFSSKSSNNWNISHG
jgi:hypothetical protein